MEGKVFQGICKTSEKAQNDYDDAISSGQTAFLVEKSSDLEIISVHLGSLSPGSECTLIFRYTMQLSPFKGGLKFLLPLTSCLDDMVCIERNLLLKFTAK